MLRVTFLRTQEWAVGSRIEITWTIFRHHLEGVKKFETHLTPFLNDPSFATHRIHGTGIFTYI